MMWDWENIILHQNETLFVVVLLLFCCRCCYSWAYSSKGRGEGGELRKLSVSRWKDGQLISKKIGRIVFITLEKFPRIHAYILQVVVSISYTDFLIEKQTVRIIPKHYPMPGKYRHFFICSLDNSAKLTNNPKMKCYFHRRRTIEQGAQTTKSM